MVIFHHEEFDWAFLQNPLLICYAPDSNVKYGFSSKLTYIRTEKSPQTYYPLSSLRGQCGNDPIVPVRFHGLVSNTRLITAKDHKGPQKTQRDIGTMLTIRWWKGMGWGAPCSEVIYKSTGFFLGRKWGIDKF